MRYISVLLVLLVLAVTVQSARRRKQKACVYAKQRTLGDCDLTTNTRNISRALVPDLSTGTDCEPFKIKTKPCGKVRNKKRRKVVCKYNKKVQWDMTACDLPGTDTMATKTFELIPHASGEGCQPTRTKSVSCERIRSKVERKKNKKMKKKAAKAKNKRERQKNRKQQRRKNRRRQACKYSAGDWGECDVHSDTVSKTLTLSSGPEHCTQTIVISKKCKCRKSCKYTKGEWGACDPNTKLRERTDTLNVESSEDFCESTRKIQKKCGKKSKKNKGCVYETGVWGDCDDETGKRTKTKTLVSGDPTKCQVEKTVSRPCSRTNGRERCFFGKWQDWEECRNGVQRKQREVLQGGDNCQRKSVKTRSCTEET